jgi:hypothetical protein
VQFFINCSSLEKIFPLKKDYLKHFWNFSCSLFSKSKIDFLNFLSFFSKCLRISENSAFLVFPCANFTLAFQAKSPKVDFSKLSEDFHAKRDFEKIFIFIFYALILYGYAKAEWLL